MMMRFVGSIFIIATLYLVRSDNDLPRVKTPLGNIQGYYKISEYGKLYEAYEGIPYALPPVGKLRFESPQSIPAWPGEIKATKLSHQCLQYNHKPYHLAGEYVIGAEDCLYLNIYIPEREDETFLLPVIFWIHGGAFIHGSGNIFGGKFLIDKNIILVTINYRLGPLGFLSTDDDIVSGNMGLKDQSMALRWIHDNIEFFGGDSKKITLIGLSAGAASVHYHYLSPLSVGLFQNGMSISGTALDCWAQTENSSEKAKKLGTLMGCPTERTNEMVECLRQRPGRVIVQAVKDFMPWLYNPFSPFGPVIEKASDNAFISRSPVLIVQSGDVMDVPWITGVTSEEGLYPVAEFAVNRQLWKELNENWELLAPHLLDFNYTLSQVMHAEIAIKIRNHYMQHNSFNQQNIKPVIKMVGDRLFVIDAEKAARMQAKVNKSPVWFYYFTYRSAESLSDLYSGTTQNFGVSHADDAYLVIENPMINPTITKSDRAMQSDLLHLWTSYANKGVQDFSPEWKKVDPSETNFNYLHISGPGKFKMEESINFGEKQFWNSINFIENVQKSNYIKNEL
ncbi:PREDICTED: venom carboxylesterase-6-like [Ceratosolen solmsi marchali]|uniref:Carboxylic ester hydrolase n=1 Tax=Ceratosolen solmsi marchali TaxID=326594 RepID=A0AAJ6VLZ3_9HYME|nr:PREDICTED: venom carboxylesterase-6-like [Ceratosolen solmsi marchali]